VSHYDDERDDVVIDTLSSLLGQALVMLLLLAATVLLCDITLTNRIQLGGERRSNHVEQPNAISN
jgi:hypothetical protein